MWGAAQIASVPARQRTLSAADGQTGQVTATFSRSHANSCNLLRTPESESAGSGFESRGAHQVRDGIARFVMSRRRGCSCASLSR
jgi:hypothetical protein